jgi:hypothetical protein
MNLETLLMLLPDEALPLLIALGGLALIVGLLSPKRLLGFLGLFVLFIALSPFIENLIGGLTLGWQLLIFIVFGIILLRDVLCLVLGRKAGGWLLGRLVYQLVVLPFRLVGMAFRTTGSILKRY